ncbi:uncharacterized protein A4U43_C08F2460 [Asparagus officinalis]|nr:uncharacterized protein A4U43_C08F2460 [Asparagus officinalis]
MDPHSPFLVQVALLLSLLALSARTQAVSAAASKISPRVSPSRASPISPSARRRASAYSSLLSFSSRTSVALMNMNRVSSTWRPKSVWAESGATLGQIYHAGRSLERFLALIGRFLPHVGSGGHVAGGGFGLLSRKYGLAADTVIDAVMIDPAAKFCTRRHDGRGRLLGDQSGGGGGALGAV